MKKLLGVVIMMFFVLSFLTSVFRSCSADYTYEPEIADYEYEYEEFDSALLIRRHHRNWLDYYNQANYAVQYAVTSKEEETAYYERDALYIDYWESDDDFWKKVYFDLYIKNKSRLDFIQDSLLNIRDSLRLNRDDFARMVVSFVQDIPYNYILPEGCEGHDDYPCVPNVKYGILSPVEFLTRLQGDCDTRTVLLFTLLKNFGYSPIIINSNEYLHSMLALDLPASGDYLIHKGKRYAFWETTNVGWLPGMLPPDMNNTSYWNVILDL